VVGPARQAWPDPLQRARTLCGQLGGVWVDPWTLAPEVLTRSEERGIDLERAARDVVGGSLLRQAVDGTTGARRRLLTVWHREVHRWCRSLAGPRQDPDDLAQEVLLRALRHLERVEHPERFRAWLYGTLLRVIRERERWARVRRQVPAAALEHHPSPQPGVEEEALASERRARVRQALESLPAEQRMLLWAHYVEGQRRREICAWSGLAPGTLNRRLTRARRGFEARCRALDVAPEEGP